MKKDNFKGSDELAAQYVPLAEQFYATYNAGILALDNRNNELYTERMTEYQGEKRENAVNFIELNLMTAQTIDLYRSRWKYGYPKVEANLQQITQRITNYNLVNNRNTKRSSRVSRFCKRVCRRGSQLYHHQFFPGEAYTQLIYKI